MPDITLIFENYEQLTIPSESITNVLVCLDNKCEKRATYIEIGMLKHKLNNYIVERLNKRDVVYIDYIDESGIKQSYEVPYLADGNDDYVVGCAPNLLQEKICLQHLYIHNFEDDVVYLAIGKRGD